MWVGGRESKRVECVVRSNGEHGLLVGGFSSKAIQMAGTISGNKQHGVHAAGKVTVAAAEHSEEVDRPQTVSTGNGEHDWTTAHDGEIEGLADGIVAL